MFTSNSATLYRLPENGRGTEGRSLDFSALPPFLRVLLITDGTVTRTLQAYFDEPIEIEVISHREMDSPRSYSDIGVAAGEKIIHRKVLLRGRRSRVAYAVAESAIALVRLPLEIQSRLATEALGIGELIRATRLETYREILSLDYTNASEWAGPLAVDAGSRIAMRRYAIHVASRPTIEITEVFPETPFQKWAKSAN